MSEAVDDASLKINSSEHVSRDGEPRGVLPGVWSLWRRFKHHIECLVAHPDFELVAIFLVLTNSVCLANHVPAEGDSLRNRILFKAGMNADPYMK
jgi:hypothetical protein